MWGGKMQVGTSYNISPPFSFRASDMQLVYINTPSEKDVEVTYDVFNVI